MISVVFPWAGTVESFVIHGDKPITALRIFPEPVAERLLQQRLLLLCKDRLLHVQHTLLASVVVGDGIIDGPAGGYECDHTAGANLIQRFG